MEIYKGKIEIDLLLISKKEVLTELTALVIC